MTEPLKRTDPITPEALERMGFFPDLRWDERFGVYASKAGQFTAVAVQPNSSPIWFVETVVDQIGLAEYTTIGELAALCRCLDIALKEVPE